jgi:hypothetical protein
MWKHIDVNMCSNIIQRDGIYIVLSMKAKPVFAAFAMHVRTFNSENTEFQNGM